MSTHDERRALHEQNRRSWNAVTAAHNSHKLDQAGFLRRGGSTLFPEELALLGEVAGKRLLHLQCNCGQDTLSLASLGADVLGVDISDAAIQTAEELARDSGLPARFERADVLEWLDAAAAEGRRFDRVFSSYGTIPWLADLPRWARGVAGVLADGGELVLMEFHPLCWSFNAEGKVVEPYFIEGPIPERGGVSDYVARSDGALSPSGHAPGLVDFENPEPAFAFQQTVGDIVQALADANLFIKRLWELPYSNGCKLFDGMEPLPSGRYGMPKGVPAVPLMLGVVATRR